MGNKSNLAPVPLSLVPANLGEQINELAQRVSARSPDSHHVRELQGQLTSLMICMRTGMVVDYNLPLSIQNWA